MICFGLFCFKNTLSYSFTWLHTKIKPRIFVKNVKQTNKKPDKPFTYKKVHPKTAHVFRLALYLARHTPAQPKPRPARLIKPPRDRKTCQSLPIHDRSFYKVPPRAVRGSDHGRHKLETLSPLRQLNPKLQTDPGVSPPPSMLLRSGGF